MATQPKPQPEMAATVVRAVQDSAKVQKHRRRCKTQRLARILHDLADRQA